jgi:hypothetical protein
MAKRERDRIRLTVPILHVTVSDDDQDGIWIANDRFTSVFGVGEDADEAVADYVANLFDQFDDLDRNERRLAAPLSNELAELRGRFVREP